MSTEFLTPDERNVLKLAAKAMIPCENKELSTVGRGMLLLIAEVEALQADRDSWKRDAGIAWAERDDWRKSANAHFAKVNELQAAPLLQPQGEWEELIASLWAQYAPIQTYDEFEAIAAALLVAKQAGEIEANPLTAWRNACNARLQAMSESLSADHQEVIRSFIEGTAVTQGETK